MLLTQKFFPGLQSEVLKSHDFATASGISANTTQRQIASASASMLPQNQLPQSAINLVPAAPKPPLRKLVPPRAPKKPKMSTPPKRKPKTFSGDWIPVTKVLPQLPFKTTKIWMKCPSNTAKSHIRECSKFWEIKTGSLNIVHAVQNKNIAKFFVSFESRDDKYKSHIPKNINWEFYHAKTPPIPHSEKLQSKSFFLSKISKAVTAEMIKSKVKKEFKNIDQENIDFKFIKGKFKTDKFLRGYLHVRADTAQSKIDLQTKLPCNMTYWRGKRPNLEVRTVAIKAVDADVWTGDVDGNYADKVKGFRTVMVK